ncbi:hypothetical protein ACTXT7_010075 [Hymenolepis weldensis]
MGDNSPKEPLMGIMVRTISHAMILKNKIKKPAKSHKIGMFTVGDLRISESATHGLLKLWSNDGEESSMKSDPRKNSETADMPLKNDSLGAQKLSDEAEVEVKQVVWIFWNY